jgi:O-antigen/teichoic acid export membrane protein
MSEAEEKANYKENLKATSLFGGVQVYNIIIGIIRSKFVAVLLGPVGMGINGLYGSTTGLIGSLADFGLGFSAVKNISEANGTGDRNRIALVISVFRKLVWVTGLLGLLACLVLSPLLSKITFGNKNYTYGFVILSCTLLFGQLSSGQGALLQGLHKYKYMAKSGVIGSTIGLIITVPLYYIWKINAIVPVLVISSITSLLLSCYFTNKVGIKSIKVTYADVRSEGTSMIKMGFFVSLNGLLVTAASYLVRIFVSNKGGLNDVGLYSAGLAIINTYVGLIFTAMGTDYYPRLSEVNKNAVKFNTLINNQIEIALLLLAPFISGFIIYIRLVVRILYSTKFLPIEGMIYWAIFATYFKATSWAIAYSFLAKGDSKAFFWNELIPNIYTLILNIVCYYFWGLTGMGVSFLISYILYTLQVWIICSKKYKLKIALSISKTFSIQFLLSVCCIILTLTAPIYIKYGLGTVLIILSFYCSYKLLNDRIGINNIIKQRILRK